MEITDVKIFPVNEDKLKAFVSIILDNCFVISDIKVIHGNNGLFVSMPSKKRKNGTFRDIAHPLNNETRKMMEERIFDEYFKSGGEQGDAVHPRALPEGEEPEAGYSEGSFHGEDHTGARYASGTGTEPPAGDSSGTSVAQGDGLSTPASDPDSEGPEEEGPPGGGQES